MAIMVTDPRNNLLSQLTAVGQQYLAGKQQERLSANEFQNKKALIELMDRLSGASDVREFGQQKELAKLVSDLEAGRLTAEGQQRLNELTLTTQSNERIAATNAAALVDQTRAAQPPRTSLNEVLSLVKALNEDPSAVQPVQQTATNTPQAAPTGLPFWLQDQTPMAPGAARWVDPTYDTGPDKFTGLAAQLKAVERGGSVPSSQQGSVLPALLGGGAQLTSDVEKAFVDIGDREDLSAVMTDDLETLKALKVKYSDLPWYKSNRSTELAMGYLNARIAELQKTESADKAKAGRLGDILGAVQVMQGLNSIR